MIVLPMKIHQDPDAFERPTLSIEVFPPAKPEGIEALASTVLRLFELNPCFVSVTYGAGGSTRERSLAVVDRLMRQTAGRVAAHVTCCACTAAETDRVIGRFLDMGVKRFFALRGDVPGAGVTPGSYADAASLVSALRRRGAEDISVACYPEVHPKATSVEADLDSLRAKLDAGASRAVSQFFLDNSVFHRFRDTLARRGIEQPLIPGILLFEDFSRAVDFAGRCGTQVPEHVKQRFARCQNDSVALRAETACFIQEQIADLAAHGVKQFHLYTLNRSGLALELFDRQPFAAALEVAAA